MPKMKFVSNAKPSLFAYPEALKPPKKEEKEKVGNYCFHFKQSSSEEKKVVETIAEIFGMCMKTHVKKTSGIMNLSEYS
jgi:26S proteasome regulatory subunit N2